MVLCSSVRGGGRFKGEQASQLKRRSSLKDDLATHSLLGLRGSQPECKQLIDPLGSVWRLQMCRVLQVEWEGNYHYRAPTVRPEQRWACSCEGGTALTELQFPWGDRPSAKNIYKDRRENADELRALTQL